MEFGDPAVSLGECQEPVLRVDQRLLFGCRGVGLSVAVAYVRAWDRPQRWVAEQQSRGGLGDEAGERDMLIGSAGDASGLVVSAEHVREPSTPPFRGLLRRGRSDSGSDVASQPGSCFGDQLRVRRPRGWRPLLVSVEVNHGRNGTTGGRTITRPGRSVRRAMATSAGRIP